ncbi:MAG: hypothetical protein WD733_24480 [Bryobacterales bacterium]
MDFLAEYGQADRRYEKIVTIAGYALLAAIVLGSVYWLFFRNWQEERRVDQFLSLLQQKSYEQAYDLWGCTVEQPCPNYSYQKFLEDWGPGSSLGAVNSYDVGRSYDQESGVIILVLVNGRRIPNLWVEKNNRVIGFSPY